ncbi:MAG TPA: hypothetical protein VG326_00705 [Tepidisphaeraceae bacterium]|nr:hypothetical protein [Tepidisphaeraceae bacterium]
MLSELSAIYYNTELLIPPIPDFRISESKIIGIYNKLKEPGGYQYKNLDLQADPPTLSTRRDDGESICKISKDKIRIEETKPNTAMTLDEFANVVKTVMQAIGSDMVPFFVQRCTMRFLSQPHGSKDAIQLLAGKLANVYDKIAPFGRPPSYFGVRFRFAPAIEVELEDDDSEGSTGGDSPESSFSRNAMRVERDDDESGPVIHKGFITLRFESYSGDHRQIWIEVAAQYPDPVMVNAMDEVERNIRHTYDFVNDKAKRFLEQFDAMPNPETEDGGENK